MKTTRSKCLCMLVCVVMLASTTPSRAGAANLSVIPSLSLSESWDSNIFNSTSNPESDYIFRAYPALTFALSAFDTTLNLGGNLEYERYARHTELNNTSQALTKNFNISVAKDKPLQISPVFTITPSVRFVETRDLVRRNQLTQNPIPGLPPTDTFVTSKTGSRIYGGALDLNYLVTPRVTLGVGGGGYRNVFTITTPGLFDSTTYVGYGSASYAITPRFSSGIFLNASDNKFDNGEESKAYSAGLTGLYRLTENHNFNFQIGATHYQSFTDNAADNTASNNQGWDPYINGSLNYVWKTFASSLFASYQVSGGGSFGTMTRRGYITLDLTDQFAERWGWNLNGYYQRNRSINSINNSTPTNVSTVGGTAGIRYNATQWASIQLSGNTFRQWSNTNADNDLVRSSVLLGISIGKSYTIAGNPQDIPYLNLPF